MPSQSIFTDVELQTIFADVQRKQGARFSASVNQDGSRQLSSDEVQKLQACQSPETLIEAFRSCFEGVTSTKHYNGRGRDDREGINRSLSHTLRERLEQVDVIIELKSRAQRKEKTEERAYIQSSTPQLDINRAIAGDPRCFIKTIELTQKSKARKIIINSPDLKSVGGGVA